MSDCSQGGCSGGFILCIIVLGRNGAALAALGDMVVLPARFIASFGARYEGMKLGESTLKAPAFLGGLSRHNHQTWNMQAVMLC